MSKKEIQRYQRWRLGIIRHAECGFDSLLQHQVSLENTNDNNLSLSIPEI